MLRMPVTRMHFQRVFTHVTPLTRQQYTAIPGHVLLLRSPLLRVDPVKEAGGLVDAHLIEESVPHLLRFDMGVEGIDAGTAEGGDVQVTGVGTTEGGAEDCVDALPEL